MDLLKRLFADFSILGLIIFILTIYAMWLIGFKDKVAFIVFSVAQILQIYIFYKKDQGFLILTMVALIIFNGLHYYRWAIGVG